MTQIEGNGARRGPGFFGKDDFILQSEWASSYSGAAQQPRPERLHVALIMDGNGRWATHRGLPRAAGHHAGAEAAREVIRAAPELGIGTLSLYGFSSDNWQRPQAEVETLMRLLRTYLLREKKPCAAQGVRISVVGRRDRLDQALLAAIAAAERETAGGTRLHLRLAVDFSGRDAIVGAAQRMQRRAGRRREPAREVFTQAMAAAVHAGERCPEIDLLVRTGGQRRLSDFMLWECAYTEFIFLEKMWPDFRALDLEAAVGEFRGRDRRFGQAPAAGR